MGCGIGSAHYGKANNIIINGGNIDVSIYKGTDYHCGIGAKGVLNNLIINGGNIQIVGRYSTAIGGGKGSGKIQINGGIIRTSTNTSSYATIGNECENFEITGGTIVTRGSGYSGLYSKNSSLKILGGSILSEEKIDIGYLDAGNKIKDTPTNGTNNLYLTKVKLKGITEKKQINKITTSDNISYGTKDMYTTENGILYLYLPEGTRNINIQTADKEYVANITTTSETSNIISIGALGESYEQEEKVEDVSKLPNEYQKVEYLESSGTQYIDTGVKGKSSLDVEVQFYSAISVNIDIHFWGSRDDVSMNAIHQNAFNNGKANRIAYNNLNYDKTIDYNYYVTKRKYFISNTEIKIDDVVIGTMSPSVWENNYSIYIFTTNKAGSTSQNSSIRVNYFKIWDNNVLVRNFIPCYRKSDNVVGMYDLVNNVFYTNSGTGTFIVGPDIN